MSVVQEGLFDQSFKVTRVGGQLLLDRIQRRFKCQPLQRIGVVQPGRQRVQHQRQAAREGARVVLAQTELDGIERGLHHIALNAGAGQCGERLLDQLLHLAGVVGGDPLQPRREGQLAQLIFQAAACQILAQAGVDQRLAQRRSGRAYQDV